MMSPVETPVEMTRVTTWPGFGATTVFWVRLTRLAEQISWASGGP
jgi:hypothetical protein